MRAGGLQAAGAEGGVWREEGRRGGGAPAHLANPTCRTQPDPPIRPESTFATRLAEGQGQGAGTKERERGLSVAPAGQGISRTSTD